MLPETHGHRRGKLLMPPPVKGADFMIQFGRILAYSVSEKTIKTFKEVFGEEFETYFGDVPNNQDILERLSWEDVKALIEVTDRCSGAKGFEPCLKLFKEPQFTTVKFEGGRDTRAFVETMARTKAALILGRMKAKGQEERLLQEFGKTMTEEAFDGSYDDLRRAILLGFERMAEAGNKALVVKKLAQLETDLPAKGKGHKEEIRTWVQRISALIFFIDNQ